MSKRDLILIFSVIILAAIVSFGFFTKSYPFTGKIGVFFWIFSYLFFALLFIKNFVFLIKNGIKSKAFYTLFLILLYVILIAINIPQLKNVSGETTQQVQCALNHLANSKDFGFSQICFLGYPSRQYLLSALPSIIFGRSVWTLNLGNSIYFMFGLIIFSAGIIKYHSHKNIDLINAILISSLLHLYYLNHSLFYRFEQSIIPISLVMIFIGTAMQFLKTKNNLLLILLGFCCQYLVFSYTPSLSFLPLTLLFFIYLLFLKISRLSKVLILITIALSIAGIINSSDYRQDVNLLNKTYKSEISIAKELTKTAEHLIISPIGNPFVSNQYSFIFLLVITLSLAYYFKWKGVILALWIVATIIFSVISRGYAYYGIDFRLQRAMVSFPVFLTLFCQLLLRLKQRSFFLSLLLFLILGSGLLFHFNFFKSVYEKEHMPFIQLLNKRLNNKNKPQILFVDKDLKYISTALNDELRYFLPELKLVETVNTRLPDCTLPQKGSFAFSLNNPCAYTFMQKFSNYNVDLLYENNPVIKSQQILIFEQ